MNFELSLAHLPVAASLAAVALIGYLFGRRTASRLDAADVQSRREIRRAKAVARDLERVADKVRDQLSRHRVSLTHFKDRVHELGKSNETAWKELCHAADAILGPTMQLAADLSHAYDEIRQQGNQLMTFTEVRTDPLTGISNRRALEEMLASLFAVKTRYESTFSLAIFDIDHFKKVNVELGHLHGDRVLQAVARFLDDAAREADMVARYGGEEFVVIMPQTDLSGALIFSERVRATVESTLAVTISGGVATALDGETPELLMRRADTALYAAKQAGRDRIHQHDGLRVLTISTEALAITPQADSLAPAEPLR